MSHFNLFFVFLLLNILNLGFAEIRLLSPEKRYGKVEDVKKEQIHYKKSKTQVSRAPEMDVIRRQNETIEKILLEQKNRPMIFDRTVSFNIPPSTTYRGILLNSVVSTNLESPLLIKILPDQGLPNETKFKCVGTTRNRRVVAACNLLLTNNGDFEISAIALNKDGSSGLKGTYYSGKDEYFAAMVANSFAKGITEISMDKLTTPFGEMAANTTKNKLLQGGINSIDQASEILSDEAKSKEPKVYIPAGREVLVYFNERLKK